MYSFGWLRPLAPDGWKLIPYWRRVHTFMSAQALTVGGMLLSVGFYLDWPEKTLLVILWVTIGVAIAGALIEQPEVHDVAEE